MRVEIFTCLLFVFVVCTKSNLVRLGSAPKSADWSQAEVSADRLTLEFPVEGTSVVLELGRSTTVPSDVPVLLGTGPGTFVLWKFEASNSDFALYVDPENQATFVRWDSNSDDQSTGGMMGVFHFHSNTYVVEPMDGRMESSRSAAFPTNDGYDPVLITVNGMRLSMKKVNRKEVSVSGTGIPLTYNATRRQDELRKFLREHSEDNFNKVTYEVEILVVLDHSIFAKWVKRSRSFDYKIREAEAINHIRYYFAEVLNGIALRYGLMSEHRIRLRPVGFYIAKSEEASYWTELPPIKQNYHFTVASEALEEFKKWLHEHDQLPPFDYAMLFTENALITATGVGRGTENQRIVSGLSDVMGVCQYSKASVCHDGGLAASIEAASWELGNSLGAYDDTACQDKTIKSLSGLREVNTDYPLQLSDCSKKALWGYLYYLKLNRTNCLLYRNNQQTAWDHVRFIQRYAGQRYTADEQCRLAHGIHSFSCTDGKKDKSICSRMHCWMPYLGRCEFSPNVVAADGTPCGDDFWCLNGQCTRRTDVPNFNDTKCAYGDYKGIVDLDKGYDCYKVGLNEPYKCYDRYFKAYCCDTCAKVERKDQQAKTCEYGDKDPKICGDRLKPSDCYQQDVASICCESCARYRINVSGCEYGDKSSTCQRAVAQKSICYENNSTCCLTCPRLQVGLKGCEWGDRMSRCRGYPINKCYDSAFAHNCCDYCNQLRIGPPNCEWGDKVNSCTRDDCLSATKKNICCKTCSFPATRPTRPPQSSSPTTLSYFLTQTTDIEMPSSRYKSTLSGEPSPPPAITKKVTPLSTLTDKQRSTTLSDKPSSTPVTTKALLPTTVLTENSPPTTLSDKPSPVSTTTMRTTSSQISTVDHHTPPSSALTGEPSTTTSSTEKLLPTSKLSQKPSSALTSSTTTSSTATEKTTLFSLLADDSLPADVLEADIIYVSDETCEDTGRYCYQIHAGRDCYSRHIECCATCRQYETNNPICPYGDKISWCRHYVSEQGLDVCDKDPFIRSECCESCNRDTGMRLILDEECQDKAGWCSSIFPGQCYDTVTRKTCCAKCSSLRRHDVRCLYGDVYSWCSKTYCSTQARQCCKTCGRKI